MLEEETVDIGLMSNNFCLIISYFLSETCKCSVSVSTEWTSVTTHAVTHTHRHTHTHTHTHTHPDNNNDDGGTSRPAFRITMHVLSGTHFKFFFFACISVYSFSQPSTSYAPAASLGVRIKYSPSTSRKESGHFTHESHEIFLSL